MPVRCQQTPRGVGGLAPASSLPQLPPEVAQHHAASQGSSPRAKRALPAPGWGLLALLWLRTLHGDTREGDTHEDT